MTAEAVRAAVSAVRDPELRQPLGDLDMVREIDLADGRARVGIALTIVGCPAADRIERDVRSAALSVPGVTSVDVAVGVMTPAERAALTSRLRGDRAARENPFGPDSLTRVIAITSGKGGVGKSTLTANLAVALARRGLAVGLIDADVHGFSIPGLLGLVDDDGLPPQPTRIDGLMLPPIAHDVRTISIGMFLPRGSSAPGAVAWRGPMLHRTVSQFLTDVYFGDIDVLLIDMPPGTGDVAISVGQLLPHADVVVVTTPQSAAADVAVRSGLVARQTGQRVVGVIENMAAMSLPDGTLLDLFGAGGGAAVAAALSADADVPLLGSVPLSPALRGDADAGVPVVVAHPDDPAAQAIGRIADAIARDGRGLSGRSLPLRVR
ncbi:Mrp/NBP35 family ATP-binding protein [Microbacterium imperiale]|uniref:Iron-sulfur cluster carrier protein n=1 Tax=Microbacterium imperiale TaxID=33884 RepID=A0A9W6HF51_9MICO|nr:Mrp/NBP35 family ATP-binding protein [Microbacterium imperiale]MBP2419327.1 ATP-binding protein involved in chromosome partitioning [Microbacterium imperiale]MDS0198803.1 Mrp/NBP35 family ATP-binding protein [Microbacterium imperiale]BFE39669.1 Mrp/NBP35 family ATP-binding protein [Microbacterium imperiale]GLJ79356.1 iron-sulfur cluster carrier protein [Microbacterium imperiale]